MKAVCVGLGLAVCLLIVKGQQHFFKDGVLMTYMFGCTNTTGEDFSVFVGLVEKCDKEFIKLEEIIFGFINNKIDSSKLFRKFCKFYPELSDCTEGALNLLKKCMKPNERIFADIFGMLQEFMCSENGKLGTAFIAEDGIDCFNRISRNIAICIPKSAGSLTETNKPFCSDLGEVAECVRTNMKTCSSKISINILEDFFKTIKEKLQCKN